MADAYEAMTSHRVYRKARGSDLARAELLRCTGTQFDPDVGAAFVAALREEGILKRVRGTPMPAASYLGGLIGSAVLNACVQVALVVAIGNLLYGVDWPQDPLLLAGFTLLGVICFACLGIAFSHAIPNADSVPAYQNAVFLPLIFISGVFYSSDDLPSALEAVAQALPIKHVIDGLSSAIVGSGTDVATAAAIVALWSAFGLYAAVRFFRWE